MTNLPIKAKIGEMKWEGGGRKIYHANNMHKKARMTFYIKRKDFKYQNK